MFCFYLFSSSYFFAANSNSWICSCNLTTSTESFLSGYFIIKSSILAFQLAIIGLSSNILFSFQKNYRLVLASHATCLSLTFTQLGTQFECMLSTLILAIFIYFLTSRSSYLTHLIPFGLPSQYSKCLQLAHSLSCVEFSSLFFKLITLLITQSFLCHNEYIFGTPNVIQQDFHSSICDLLSFHNKNA